MGRRAGGVAACRLIGLTIALAVQPLLSPKRSAEASVHVLCDDAKPACQIHRVTYERRELPCSIRIFLTTQGHSTRMAAHAATPHSNALYLNPCCTYRIQGCQ